MNRLTPVLSRVCLALGLLLPLRGLVAQDTIDNALLWEISGKGLEKPSWLYGTIHMIPSDSFFVVAGLEERLRKADGLIMELSMDFMEMGGANAFAMIKSLMLPRGQNLKSLLDSADYQYLDDFMRDSLSMPFPFYNRVKPIFTAQYVSSTYCEGSDQTSYEMYFKGIADSLGIPISGLETIEEQLAALDKIPLAEQSAGLMETVRDPRQACEDFAQLVSLYRRQDLQALMEMTLDEADAEGMEELLDKRNQTWIPRIEESMDEGSVFIAVGAGHLPGPVGVIALLRKRGYRVMPVTD